MEFYVNASNLARTGVSEWATRRAGEYPGYYVETYSTLHCIVL